MPSPVGDSRAWREAGEIGLSAAGMQNTVVSYRAHVLSIRVKLQALIYGAGQFVRAGYAVVREKLDDITRGYCGFRDAPQFLTQPLSFWLCPFFTVSCRTCSPWATPSPAAHKWPSFRAGAAILGSGKARHC